MSQNYDPGADEDLTPHFQWRWGEHGIYLAVCSIIGLFVLGLHALPTPPKRNLYPTVVEVIQVRYLTAAEPAAADEPFHDPRLIRLPTKLARRAM
jgi:hypothetical protein